MRFLRGGELVGEADVSSGRTILEASIAARAPIETPCGGRGVCGRCAVTITERGQTCEALACRMPVRGDPTVTLPDEAPEEAMRILSRPELAEAEILGGTEGFSPVLVRHRLQVDAATLTDQTSDLSRLERALQKALLGGGLHSAGGGPAPTSVELHPAGAGSHSPGAGPGPASTEPPAPIRCSLHVLCKLPVAIRGAGGQVTVTILDTRSDAGEPGAAWRSAAPEVFDIDPGPLEGPPLGLALDLGTTTLAMELVDLGTGSIHGVATEYNPQGRFGDDLLSRIDFSEKPGGLERLREEVIGSISRLARRLAGERAGEIGALAIGGNTTMIHILLGLSPRTIREEPYVPAVNRYPRMRAGAAGLDLRPDAVVLIVPGVAGYMGGDVVGGAAACGIHCTSSMTLFLDLGTNGEIVLGNRDWLLSAACSAGPAFEGIGVSSGVRAVPGAIEEVRIDAASLEPTLGTIDGRRPIGICGSGMIGLIGELMRAGVVDRSGRFLRSDSPRIRRRGTSSEYVLVPEDESATGRAIAITEPDLAHLIRTKAAVFAGTQLLLDRAGLSAGDLDRVTIAGGFGRSLDIEGAVLIGLLPDIERSRFRFVGNASILGARLTLLSGPFRRECDRIARSMTYIELSADNDFMDRFTAAMFLPHTDIRLFPTARKHLDPP